MFITRSLPDTLLRFRPDDPPQGGDDSTPAPATPSAAEIPQGLASMLSKHNNDSLKVMEILHGDNFQLREKNRQLQAQIDADKPAWEQYKALGAPAEIAAKLREADIEKIAVKAQYSPSVLAKLDKMAGGKLVYEAKVETVDGEQVERVYVRDEAAPEGHPASAPQLLSEYAAANWSEFLPSLTPVASGQGPSSNGLATPPPATPAGVRFPPQHPGGGTAPKSDLVSKFVQEQNEKAKAAKNPLLKS